MTWKYPEPRALSAVELVPVPFTMPVLVNTINMGEEYQVKNINIHINIHTSIREGRPIYIHIRTHTYTRTQTQTQADVDTNIGMRIHTLSLHTFIHIHAYVRTFIYTCMHFQVPTM